MSKRNWPALHSCLVLRFWKRDSALRYRLRLGRFVNRPNNRTGDPEFEQVTHKPAAEDFARQWVHRKRDQVVANKHQPYQDSQHRACACAAHWNKAGVKQGQKKCHHQVTQNQPVEVTAKLCFGSPKRWHFTMDVMHKLPVPKESKHEDEDKGCDECEEEFFPIHNFFLLSFLLSPDNPEAFIAKRRAVVDLNSCCRCRGAKAVWKSHALLGRHAFRTLCSHQPTAHAKYWEIIADNLSKAGWSWGCISAVACDGRTIWIADLHRDDGKRFVVRADEKLTAFAELQLLIAGQGGIAF